MKLRYMKNKDMKVTSDWFSKYGVEHETVIFNKAGRYVAEVEETAAIELLRYRGPEEFQPLLYEADDKAREAILEDMSPAGQAALDPKPLLPPGYK